MFIYDERIQFWSFRLNQSLIFVELTDQESVHPPDTWQEPPQQPFFGLLGQFHKLKQAGKRFCLTLSIGGWTWSKHFSDAVSSQESRDMLATSIVHYVQKYPIFNGINVDWEYLSNNGLNNGLEGNSARKEDARNFIAFVETLRKAQRAQGLDLGISMCLPGSASKAQFPIKEVIDMLDEVHIMTYDFASSSWGGSTTTHQTNLRKSRHTSGSVEEAVKFYIDAGVPREKILIGATFYSRGFANTDGLGCLGSGVVADKSWEDGICDYKSLPRAGATEHWDAESQAGYSFDPVKRTFNSYDTVDSIRAKCQYVKEQGLKGIIVWESSGDFPINHPRSLTRVLHEELVKPYGLSE